MNKVIRQIVLLAFLPLAAATLIMVNAPSVNAFASRPRATPTAIPTATPQPTATFQPLFIDTASEGYSCSNGVCAFPAGNVGSGYAAPITSGGGQGPTPYTWSVVAGSLPDGLSLTVSYGVYSAYVYGTPKKEQSSTFTLQVRDGQGHTARQAFTLTIGPPPPLVITLPGATANSGVVGQSYNQNLFASGGVQPYTWSISGGQLPPGLVVSKLSNGGWALTGTPTTRGTFTFSLTVADSNGTRTTEQTGITIS